MSANQIISVSNQANSSGTNGKPNGVVQLQSNANPAFVLCDNQVTYINGIIVPSGGGLNQINAQDSSCSVVCSNGGDITQNCSTYNVNMSNSVYFSMPADFQVTSNNVYLNVGSTMLINNNPSSQQNISYGQAKWPTDSAQELYHINYDNPEIGQPQFNLRMFGVTDFNQWFQDFAYNPVNNNILYTDGDGFRWTNLDNKMVEISWNFQLYYTFDGQQPATYLCTGLFDVDNQFILPQSITWFQTNDIKHKYLSFTTKFTMRKDNVSKYVPFFMQHTNNQVQVYDFGGNSRSWIKFKEMQFISY